MNFSLTETFSKTGYLRSKDQTPLFYRHYMVEKPIASILLVHGFGEHSGRYFYVVDKLRKENFEVFCIDFRGHGHSEGKRGDIETFRRYEDDVLAAIDHVRAQKTAEKLFLIAHSMGALVSLRALRRSKAKIHGAVLSSPLFALKMPMPVWKKWASFAAARLVPHIRVKTGIKGRQLSSDHEIVKAYDGDPLVLKTLSVRAFKEIYESCQQTHASFEAPDLSFLMQVAGNDPVVDAQASLTWFNHIDKSRTDATMKIYPGFLHEIYNETHRHEAIEDFLNWLKNRV